METKRYQSYCEGANTENKWAQMPNTMDYCCSAEETLTNSDALMNIVNSSSAPNMPSVCKTTMLRLNQNPPSARSTFNNTYHNRKSETDSKELSKTVAESMGLYMNAVREADFGFGQQGTAGGQKLYPLCGTAIEEGQPKMTGSTKMKAPPASFPSGPQLPNGVPQECVVGSATVPSVLPTALSCRPEGPGPMSSPTGNNMVSSTTSPTYFESDCPSLASAGSNLTQGHHTSSNTGSPVKSSVVGSPPLASPLSVMKSPVSSPHSIGSVRSPLSCNTNVRSSISSPTGNGGNVVNIGTSISSPPTFVTMAMSSPRNSSRDFSASSPPSGLGLVQNDTNSPEGREHDFKGFEFPKVENVDGEIFNIGLDAMGVAKYIKNEPGTDYRSMCLGGSKSIMPHSPFVTQIKTEPKREVTCSNPQFCEPQHSLGCFHSAETTYLSLRDNIDEYSLSGILGPPVSSLNGNYEPGVFPNNGLPKGIKQETNDGSYYQENNNVPTSAIVGVNSSGHSFHYQIGAQGTMSFSCHNLRDQTNPLLNLISPVTGLMETWKTRTGLSQGPLSARVEGYPGPGCLTENMESRQDQSHPHPNEIQFSQNVKVDDSQWWDGLLPRRPQLAPNMLHAWMMRKIDSVNH
ncbi:mineralocorticoid receptor [Triplophysa rosa]|uniref:Mineralocorticoid receptor n=1 Tax=Triplophysa rosa TaxID=992332 RepID=A0A9W8C8Q1_TRIRA|nr:mineralocorticoid receptor [Triplophysa rosa]